MLGTPTQLIIILAIVLVLFGAKKLRNVGSDLGAAIKNFRSSVKEGEAAAEAKTEVSERVEHNAAADPGRVIEAEVVAKDRDRA
ncbi:MAG TPA: twin-arginine translocase TatA/TatE family subunit [Gammaproteobacteria bacterium]|nr:twin-arginine translocase TatA/TatE family subunit [Gammaproteobacteria bacterium]